MLISTAVLVSFVVASAPKPTKELLEKGKASFAVNCAACHGEKGLGDGPGAAALNPKPRNYTTDKFKNGETPDDVFKTLAAGLPNTAMVAFAHLPEDERWALTLWVLELKKAGAKK